MVGEGQERNPVTEGERIAGEMERKTGVHMHEQTMETGSGRNSAIASIEATDRVDRLPQWKLWRCSSLEAAASAVFYSSCLDKSCLSEVMPANSKNDEHKEKLFLY